MAWAERLFKGKDKVWVLVDDAGNPVVEGGRVSMRYNDAENAKVYQAAAANIQANGAAAKPKTKSKPARPTVSFDELIWQDPDGEWVESDLQPQELDDQAPPPPGIWEFFTDGACSGNPGPCGWGWLLRHDDRYLEAKQFIGTGTNNIAEMMAILTALQIASEDLSNRVVIHTDSSLSIGLLTQGWKAKKNKALVEAVRELIAEFDVPPAFVKVKGHSGHPLNDRADFMATSAISDAIGN